ncbi:MAG: LysR family transcriptional regulator [Ruminococcaceae bacterium]|nr:LysR family transcriptional regulator [Oscillospiraceae bacterium]
MSIKKYEAFLKTAQLGSLTRAAEALHSTQSRISHILRELEEEFGFSLMQRSRGGIRLTEAGERLMPLMKEILQKQQELETLAADIREAEAGVVRIGVFSSVAVQWLPGMLESFQTTHPKAEVQILSGDYDDLDRWLQSGDVDLSFVTLPAPDGMQVIPLQVDSLVVILPRGHQLAKYEAVPIPELRSEPFISLRQSSNHDIHRALDKAGVQPHIRYSTRDDYALIAMVQQGLGVSIVPELLIGSRREGIEVRPLSPAATRTIALAIPSPDPLPVVSAFAETAVEWLKKNA